jgi:hypothetical protein
MTFFTPPVDGRVDDVLGTDDVRLHRLKGVVLGSGHLLHRRGMDHIVNTLEGTVEPLLVPYITYEIADFILGLVVFALHFKLLVLVPAEDNHLFRLVVVE